jgi:hypothetical protein
VKAEADLFFLQGINQLIGHGWPYSPKEAGEPGWAFYAAMVLNDHNPWWLVMPDVTRYLQRVSYVLRQGQPANDVAILLPTDDAWAQFAPGKASVSESMPRLLGPEVIPRVLDAGFNFDFIDAETIAKTGISYPVLILPGVERLPLSVYRQIETYVHNGGVVIATRSPPSHAPGSIWKPPYELEISGKLHPGQNHLKIVVGNLAINTMAGHSLPDRTLLNSKYGVRAIPQDMENLEPLPSGLLGPLRLVIEQEPSHGGN